jgi:hypothetical protein
LGGKGVIPMSKLKERYLYALEEERKRLALLDDDLHQCKVSEVKDKLLALTAVLDMDDVIGNRIYSYCIQNINEIASSL